MLKDAGIEDQECIELVKDISNRCDICLKYKRTPPRPVVSLLLGRDFDETVAIDLKHWDKNVWFLHLIDLATRFSVSSVITSRHKEVVLNKILLMWIGTGVGTPSMFIADNGGEFANEDYKDIAENLDITNTAGESPWSNGLCERNHAVIDEVVH